MVVDARGGKAGGARSFWTDGSGLKKRGMGKVLATGWATMEIQMNKGVEGKIDMEVVGCWKGKSRDLQSVPLCETRAILKAAQEAREGEMIHVHTDSKVTVMKIRSMIEEEGYMKKRRMEHKKLVEQVLGTLVEKKAGMILEWVKGHEDMHNTLGVFPQNL